MSRPDPADPFGTAALREGIVAAWSSSPTRLREDAATESDHVRAGYRDRVLTELAQNAADAAARAGIPGELRVRVADGRLHVANVGEPLDVGGVHALTALRSSNKMRSSDENGADSTVGRFGVGFTAVLSISDDIEVRSRTGSIRFSAERTRAVLAEHDLPEPESGVPVLRLVWATAAPPVPGSDTEIVLALRAGIDPAAVLGTFRSEAYNILLELPGLQTVVIGDDEFTRHDRELGNGLVEVRIDAVTDRSAVPEERTWWQFTGPSARWLVPVVDGRIEPVGEDVLRAPTRSDEELSLPALVIADVAMQPDRRRVLPGARVEDVARGYAQFVAALPAEHRLDLVPVPGFARSEVDGRIREAILEELRCRPWLPAADGRADLVPDRAAALPSLTDTLADVLGEVVPGLVVPEMCRPRHAAALAAVDVHRLGLARLADLLSGHERPPKWWNRLYEALTPLVVDAVTAEELASLPVPLSDGRTVTGPRTTVLAAQLQELGPMSMPWVRLVHPDAAHPLLARLGAGTVTAEDLLSDPALVAAVEDADPDDTELHGDLPAGTLADVVLRLVPAVPAAAVPRELGSLLLPDTHGDLVPADELLLPGAPLAEVLVEDAPFGTVDRAVVDRYGPDALRAIGVGWGFTVLRSDLPTGPDHDLPGEEAWWERLEDDPDTLVAVRDLDLVDDRRWSRALTLLAADPVTAETLADPAGYTAWYLRTHAVLDGRPLGHFRFADDTIFDGLLDPCTHPDASVFRGALAGTAIDGIDLAQTLLDRLADPGRSPGPAAVVAAHSALAAAFATGGLDPESVTLPDSVRSLSGAVVDAAHAIVPDDPWFANAIPHDRLVLGGPGTAHDLADVLDIAVASAVIEAEPADRGRRSTWEREPAAVLAGIVTGVPLPRGEFVLHDRLTVRCSGALTGEIPVEWWVDATGTVHSTPHGLPAALTALARPGPRTGP
ncbi:sacsin N-terminal ATP-binding-like domain-containing protein [Rhodococcus sp. CH91]|uniref:sacsin N-terminal ATP-binding-like domain-containing protein n=1 Tax=Rhodococcus sp. CH91 TaxID=2910256 RepID=UPI001F4BA331|nr:ATP-binding protein [Rhodococcus sp. CH91]